MQFIQSAAVFQERLDFGVGAAEMENQCVFLALENQTQIKTAAAFHERRDASEADAGVKVWHTVRDGRCFHRLMNLGLSPVRDAFQKPRGGEQLHAVRSATLLISRS